MSDLAGRVLILLISLALISACQTTEPLSYRDEGIDDIPVPVVEPEALTVGSLYQEATAVRLFVDRKAYRVGDILTITLDELTRSSKKADTAVNKKSSIAIPDPTIFGKTGAHILGSGRSLANTADIDRGFTGKGSTGQSNMLVGSVTVMVQAVLENGTLYVKGSKTIRLTQGDEVLYISGLVRPEDISPDNRVSSKRLAEAKISYTGKGDLADANTQGWLNRILNSRLFPF
ncbi:flagellar basal body L-ring protein FlgH [Sansalvadorimonas sp. 2012CJ34-2]|uniref:Flagellar L-ring protein n=1 Tax=Parendozoicomonas callyspongiae TaxID=2942213 RepID=A0ABT0PDU3_9GAMM|nr:flagellar basal body L-ring protein FlgH [Sansalvadorimonas sp. 2012CJ34-2]MCL6269554.1 flagellar basal body L-ring protein FlgH [Sansalvadorimonas sp. 2012CJ34-2]